jgi:hypothetical protein
MERGGQRAPLCFRRGYMPSGSYGSCKHTYLHGPSDWRQSMSSLVPVDEGDAWFEPRLTVSHIC